VPATSTLAPAAAARRAVSGLMPPSTCTQAPHHHAHTPVQEKDIAGTYMHTCSNPLRIHTCLGHGGACVPAVVGRWLGGIAVPTKEPSWNCPSVTVYLATLLTPPVATGRP
jgi:hypothetical protein